MRAYGCDVGCGFGTVSLLTDEGVDPVVLLPKSLPGFLKKKDAVRYMWSLIRKKPLTKHMHVRERD